MSSMMSDKQYVRIGHEVHVVPTDDVVMHDESRWGECACVPAVEAVKRDDGSTGWLYIHHAFDGRTDD